MADIVNRSGKTPSARDIYDLKEQAKLYYRENKVPEKMEDILNSMFYDKPQDVYGHLANYFETFANKPMLSKITAQEVLDSNGQPTIQAKVYCTVMNNVKLVSSAVGSNQCIEPDHALLQDREAENTERQEFVSTGVELINTVLNNLIAELDPTQQKKIDETILEYFITLKRESDEKAAAEKAEFEKYNPTIQPPTPAATPTKGKGGRASAKGKIKGPPIEIIPDEPHEQFVPGCNSVSVVSIATCKAGAKIKDVPLYQHIAALKNEELPGQYVLPQLMTSIISGGRTLQGKQNCVKDYLIIPRHDIPIKQAVKHVTNIYNTVAKNLCLKGGISAKYTNDSGNLCPVLDRPEQGIDLINEAVNQLGLKLNEDFFIALNCGAQEIYDFEKGKYEVVQGQLKLSEEMVDFWVDIVSRYPSVIALIDPIRKQEKDSWMRLCEKLSEKCLIVGDFVLHRPGLLKDESIKEDFKTSAAVLRMNNMNSVCDVITVCRQLEEENHMIISSCAGDNEDSFIADLAVGCGCRFLRVGAPCRGERVSKINRLVDIESELETLGALKQSEPLNFHKIDLPSLPPPPATENMEDESEKKK